MEPLDQSRLVTRYTIPTRVVRIIQKKEGWFVHFEGSWEMLNLGLDRPDLEEGDEVIITIQRRLPNAKAEPTPV